MTLEFTWFTLVSVSIVETQQIISIRSIAMSHLRNPKPITDSKEFVKRMNDLRSQTVSAQALAEAQHIVDVENSFDDMLLEEHFNDLANSEHF